MGGPARQVDEDHILGGAFLGLVILNVGLSFLKLEVLGERNPDSTRKADVQKLSTRRI